MKKMKQATYEINFKENTDIQQNNALPKMYFPVIYIYLFSENLKFLFMEK
jgi:hypothetical protein